MMADNLLDTSNYPTSHSLHSTNLKAKLGCIKDEGGGEIFEEWILLRPKCYSMLAMTQMEHRRAKGVQRSVVSTILRHSDYKKVFVSSEDIYQEVRGFRSTLHTITTTSTRKRALSLWEDKRAWVSPNTSVAYGHFSLSSPPSPKRARVT